MTAQTQTFEEVWSTHKNLIYKLANQFNLPNDQRDDLIQHGRIGIHRAMLTYKEDAGSTFTSWVYTYAKKEMIEYVNQNLRTIRIPVSFLRKEDKEELPTQNVVSLDTSIYDDGSPLYSTIAYEEDTNEINPFILHLRHFLPQLKERYQNILNLRYMQEKTYEEIAEELEVSKENIRQLHDKAINKLQQLMGVDKKIQRHQRVKTQKRKKDL